MTQDTRDAEREEFDMHDKAATNYQRLNYRVVTFRSLVTGLLALIVSTVGALAEETTPQVSEPRPLRHILGAKNPLCKSLMKFEQKRAATAAGQCFLSPYPSEAELSSPNWVSRDIETNAQIVKEILVWRLISGNWLADSRTLHDETRKAGKLSPEMVEKVWAANEAWLKGIFDSSAFRLEEAEIALPGLAAPLTAYRTTHLIFSGQAGAAQWTVDECAGSVTSTSIFIRDETISWNALAVLNHISGARRDLLIRGKNILLIHYSNPVGLDVFDIDFVPSVQSVITTDICSIQPK
jgi:hypothetical protein